MSAKPHRCSTCGAVNGSVVWRLLEKPTSYWYARGHGMSGPIERPPMPELYAKQPEDVVIDENGKCGSCEGRKGRAA